jgi:protein-L-isoaspartate(D-aspartate) O-methyltransferase
MSKLVNNLIKDGYLKSDSVIDAFSEVQRIEFVPREFELQSEANIALPLGYGQTISQPLTVAVMLELLDVQRGSKVLDVGSGSGWTTALLSHIVGEEGKVVGVEIIKELKDLGEKNVDKYGYIKKGIAEIHNTDGSRGFAEQSPYDRILVSAAAPEVPQELKDQLKIGGKMVIPVKSSLLYLEKRGADDFYKEEFPGFSFVPLILT